ncbi:MAG: hypothetical protein CR993_03325 [Rhodobacterales bacterium]|nr:MAG: hypothetical protein CR993_03325 [Rhodobacterales bacterium]
MSNRTPKFKSTFITLVILSMTGCASSGTMQGIIRGKGTPVQFQYEQGLDRDFYTTVIGNEKFSGQAVNSGAVSGFGNIYTPGGVNTVITYATSGNFIAVMMGDKGSSMRCEMTYADSSGYTPMGGVGICRVSDGRVIDITW